MSLNFELTHDQRAMVSTVRELSQDLLKPNWLKYMDGTFPWDNMRALAKIGDSPAADDAGREIRSCGDHLE